MEYKHTLKIYEFKDFLDDLDHPDKPTFEEFKKVFMMERRSWVNKPRYENVYEHLKSLPETDWRNSKNPALWGEPLMRDELMNVFYHFFVLTREEKLKWFFDKYVSAKGIDMRGMNFQENIRLPDGSINGQMRSIYSRIIKNIHYEHIYGSDKINTDNPPVLKFIEAFRTYKAHYQFKQPSSCKKMKDNWLDFFKLFLIILSRMSVFNPYTFGWITKNVLRSKRIFTPVLGWSSYALGCINNPDIEEYVASDVIPEVCEKTDQLFDLTGSRIKRKIYCCPDEELDARHDFSNVYKEHFDSVLFSPPYFDLELYNSENQSCDSYKDYNDWLEKYWHATVKVCYNVLQKGGKFAFVISDYKYKENGKGPFVERHISKDLKDIALKYFKHVKDDRICWNNNVKFVGKQKDGVFENLYIMEKE